MNSQRVFQCESLDLASYLNAAGHEIIFCLNPSGNRALFQFEQNEYLRADIVSYEGGAPLPAKRLLNIRSWLYREASRIVREGGRS
jgi:hypothetical protein